jgi:hypothetical protein
MASQMDEEQDAATKRFSDAYREAVGSVMAARTLYDQACAARRLQSTFSRPCASYRCSCRVMCRCRTGVPSVGRRRPRATRRRALAERSCRGDSVRPAPAGSADKHGASPVR